MLVVLKQQQYLALLVQYDTRVAALGRMPTNRSELPKDGHGRTAVRGPQHGHAAAPCWWRNAIYRSPTDHEALRKTSCCWSGLQSPWLIIMALAMVTDGELVIDQWQMHYLEVVLPTAVLEMMIHSQTSVELSRLLLLDSSPKLWTISNHV